VETGPGPVPSRVHIPSRLYESEIVFPANALLPFVENGAVGPVSRFFKFLLPLTTTAKRLGASRPWRVASPASIAAHIPPSWRIHDET